MLPSEQRFEPEQAAVLQIDERLIMHHQFVAIDSVPEIVLEMNAFQEPHSQFFCKYSYADGLFLGIVHGDVRVTQYLFGGVVFGVAGGYADIYRYRDAVTAQ